MMTASAINSTTAETKIVYGLFVLPTPSTNVCSNIKPSQERKRGTDFYTGGSDTRLQYSFKKLNYLATFAGLFGAGGFDADDLVVPVPAGATGALEAGPLVFFLASTKSWNPSTIGLAI